MKAERRTVTCRKIQYASYREADKVPDKYGHPYKCKQCGMWHLGHARKRKRIAALKASKVRRKWRAMLELVDVLCGVKYGR
jgi:hypothetical protein